MRSKRLYLISLVICGLLLLMLTGYVLAQGGGESPAYVGQDECQICHRGLSRAYHESYHARALISVEEAPERIVADFTTGEEVRTIQLPGEDSPRPFTLEDAVYALGAGKYAQRFIVEDTDGTLLVLPIEWSAIDGAWHTVELAPQWPDPAYNFVENCAYCHTTGLNRDSGAWLDDGVRCETCHGPGSEHVRMADEAGIRPSNAELAEIRGAIYNNYDAQVCGQCHGRGTAPDGRPYPLNYLPGNTLLDEAVYTLNTPENDPVHWWSTGHASEIAMQFNEWVASAHASSPEDLAAYDFASDDCLRCHSGDYIYNAQVRAWIEDGILKGEPPEALTLETAQFGVVCQTCHNPHADPEMPDLLRDEPYTLCVSCHSNESIEGVVHHPNREMYEGLALELAAAEGMPAAVPGAHFTAENGPDCATCHMPQLPTSEGDRASHTMLVVMPGAPEELEAIAGCTSCHTDITADQMASLVTDTRSSTAARVEAARAALSADTPEWVALALDMVAGDGSGGLHNYTYTQALLHAAEAELGLLPEPAASEEATVPEWVELPLLGVVPGLTQQNFIIGGAITVILLLAGVVLLFTPAWRKLVGILLILAALALATSPWWAYETPARAIEVTGDNAYCTLCHSGERTFMVADGQMLFLGVSLDELAASVHGADNPNGAFGCLDCHGADAFPHGPAPVNLRAYRLAGNSVCIDCHTDSLEHYETVQRRNIAVACVDCHGAHAVQPAETLEELTAPRPRPAVVPPGEPAPVRTGEPPVVRREGPPPTESN
ncbi:MAG: hypothetical protein Kow0077_22160 [Anaerolineae bacterium]